ncbi:MAG: extracellular solute-binding protein, partial [Agathobacter sp.]
MGKRTRSSRKMNRIISMILVAAMLFPMGTGNIDASTSLSLDDYEEIVNQYAVSKDGIGYEDYLLLHDEIRPDAVIEVDADTYVRYEEDDSAVAPKRYENYEGMDGTSILTTEDSLIEYEVTVSKTGYYDMSIIYYPVEGKNSAIQRSIFLDGELPYSELSLVEFQRIWKMDVENAVTNKDGIGVIQWQKDNQGNDLKPSVIEIPEWITSYVYDSEGYVTTELSLYLTAGTHTITLAGLREPMLLRKVIFSNETNAESYDVVKGQWDAQGAANTSGQMIRIEAENVSKTSSQMLYAMQDQSSPAVYPASPKELLNNTIGGNSWRLNGQWMEWEFDVKESGYYNIALFDKQNFVKGIYVSRRISIDGKVPFEEFEDYGFTYKSGWRLDTLSDSQGNPYSIYLEKGTHTLRMEVVLGEFADIISDIQECVTQLNDVYRSVIKITGVAPDKYRDYEIEDNLPELKAKLVVIRETLDNAIAELQALIGTKSDKEAVLITMRDQLDELIYDQERFSEVLSAYKINVRATANWITQVIDQPLQLDRIYIYSPEEKIKIENNGFFAGLWHEICRLFYSFIIDYNQIGNVSDDKDATTITLWIGTGRDQANVIKSLIDSTFTPTHGINVNVQLVDMNTLLRATLAGEGPDVAIQVPNTNGAAGAVLSTANDSAVNYGIRNAVLDLTQFKDYEEVVKRFSKSSLVQLQFNGATYGLPETQTFQMMFYRKDILAELGMEIPQTWDDVKVAMSVLAKNQMEFGMLPSEQIFAMLLYQNGGSYYNADGSASALDS